MGRLKKLILTGANFLAQGYTDFDSWAARMIQEFGPVVEPFLEEIMRQARELHGSAGTGGFSDSVKKWGRLFMAKNVLIVDDEPNIVLSLKFLIAQEGYEVRTATNGEEALLALAERVPDLVLLDVMMPKPDGFEVCQTIRATPEWREIPVIMLTAKGREVEKQKGLAMGADDYITKPFATKDLVAKVQAFLQGKKP
jgi:CheY-like chemotaxis protein